MLYRTGLLRVAHLLAIVSGHTMYSQRHNMADHLWAGLSGLPTLSYTAWSHHNESNFNVQFTVTQTE